jgi:outer membrane protein TolC
VREYTALGNVVMDIDTSGRLRAAMARARADQAAAAAALALSERDVKRAVAAAYYRTLLARHLAQATRDSLEEARSFEKRTTLLAQNGEAARADVVKAGAETAFLEQALNAAELEARLATHDLAAFWTADVDAPLELVDTLAEPAAAPEPAAAGTAPYLGRPEFRFFDAQRSGFQADARRAFADRLPQLSLVGQYGLDSLRCSWADRGYASFISLHIPVFDWFKARSAERQFNLQADQVTANRQAAERQFSRDYRDALARAELVYSQIAIAERQVRLSEDNLKLSRVRYEGGEGLALDVVAAQSQLTQARTNYFTAKANYLNAKADLEVAAGR